MLAKEQPTESYTNIRSKKTVDGIYKFKKSWMKPKCGTLILSPFLYWFMYVLSLNPIISQEITFIGQWKQLSNVSITKINVWQREAELIYDEGDRYLNVAVGQWSP